MQALIIALLCVIAALALGLAVFIVRALLWRAPDPGSAADYERTERARMPTELANGQLVVNEKTLKRGGARPLFAKMDQVFLTPSGVLVPMETKARGYVTPADIVQLSAQAAVLAYSRAEVVARWGYVRLAPPNRRPIYRRVNLLSEVDLDVLWDRWAALKAGRATAAANPHPHRCRNCALRDRCPDRI